MNIKLKFTAQIKDAVGQGIDAITIGDNEKIQDVLDKLVDKYGNPFKAILFDKNNKYRNSNLIAINQFQVDYDENHALNDGDEITLMSPISGG